MIMYKTTEEYILARVQKLENENQWLSETIKENEKQLDTCQKLIEKTKKEKVNNETQIELFVELLKQKANERNGYISFDLIFKEEPLYQILYELLGLGKEKEDE